MAKLKLNKLCDMFYLAKGLDFLSNCEGTDIREATPVTPDDRASVNCQFSEHSPNLQNSHVPNLNLSLKIFPQILWPKCPI